MGSSTTFTKDFTPLGKLEKGTLTATHFLNVLLQEELESLQAEIQALLASKYRVCFFAKVLFHGIEAAMVLTLIILK